MIDGLISDLGQGMYKRREKTQSCESHDDEHTLWVKVGLLKKTHTKKTERNMN